MSKTALVLLMLSLLAGALLLLTPPLDPLMLGLVKLTLGLSVGALVAALAVGRRFKFDPILR
ncbi:MAG: PA3371 family protein [Pseudomonas sp.]|uniref:PA3371 family protein n=1 Tax=Pseudomonas sp. TaxID=306 RepID=UPI0033953FC0